MKKTFYIITGFFFLNLNAQIGINTSSPQEELHVAGSTSSIRIDGLNSTNNSLNIGNNGNSRVFVNANGDLVLGQAANNVAVLFSPDDYLLSNEANPSSFNQTGTGSGYQQVGEPNAYGEGLSQFTLSKNAIIEINYALSWRLKKNNSTLVDDGGARIVQSLVRLYKWDLLGNAVGYVTTDLEGIPIILSGALGLNGQFYTNNNGSDGASNLFHNTGTDYVSLGPGIYRPMFFVQVAVSNTMGTGAIQFSCGAGQDEMQVIAHYYN